MQTKYLRIENQQEMQYFEENTKIIFKNLVASSTKLIQDANENINTLSYILNVDLQEFKVLRKTIYIIKNANTNYIIANEQLIIKLQEQNIYSFLKCYEYILDSINEKVDEIYNNYKKFESEQMKNMQNTEFLNNVQYLLLQFIQILQTNELNLVENNQIKKNEKDKLDKATNLIIQKINSYVLLISTKRETIQLYTNNRLNDTMRILTMLTVFLAIPNLLFAFYGMNINLPYAQNNNVLLIITSVIILIEIMIYVLIKKRYK